jgi:hypothetical protein
MFAHKMNKSWKLLLETGQTRQFDFIGFGGSQGHRRLRRGRHSPSQVTSDQGGQDPRQLKELWQRLRDLNEVKTKEKKTRIKV